jgi:hypothetical protein|tara:strand:- start:349 stop:1116 length:768 start_codon:yes stop_codon:yes gene_type:complete
MKFTIDSDTLKKALESVQVKGKGTTSGGFGNTNFGSYAYIVADTASVEIWNGNPTFCVKIVIDAVVEEQGRVCVDSSTVIPYLKNFSGEDIIFSVGDFVLINCGTKKASIPLVVNHPNADAISRLQNMLNPISYEIQPQTLFNFGKSKFEGAFTLTQRQLQDSIKACELVKSGVYKFDFNKGVLNVSTRLNVTNKYEETITPAFPTGEPATVEFSSPIYAFFEKDQMLNFYMRDDFPLLVVANDRMLLKAPHISG